MRWLNVLAILAIMLITIYTAFAIEITSHDLYEKAKIQCLQRFDKDNCIAYFGEVIKYINDSSRMEKTLIAESYSRKEGRYYELQIAKEDSFAGNFREQLGFSAKLVDGNKQKLLRGMEIRALHNLKEFKKTGKTTLQQYNDLINKAQCAGLDNEECNLIKNDLEDTRRHYLLQASEGVWNGLTAILAFTQRTTYINEKDTAMLTSEINQKLAEVRLIRSILSTNKKEGLSKLPWLVSESRRLNAKISLMHTHGQLYSIQRKLSAMQIKWERKTIHAKNIVELAPHLTRLGEYIDAAGNDLNEAEYLLSNFKVSNTKRIMSFLSKTYVELISAYNEQKTMLRLMKEKDISFNIYDMIEEGIDDELHGFNTEPIENQLEESTITAKLYPEKGETLVTLSYEPSEKYTFPTVDEQKLIELIAEKTKQSEDKVKQQLRFELGGK